MVVGGCAWTGEGPSFKAEKLKSSLPLRVVPISNPGASLSGPGRAASFGGAVSNRFCFGELNRPSLHGGVMMSLRFPGLWPSKARSQMVRSTRLMSASSCSKSSSSRWSFCAALWTLLGANPGVSAPAPGEPIAAISSGLGGVGGRMEMDGVGDGRALFGVPLRPMYFTTGRIGRACAGLRSPPGDAFRTRPRPFMYKVSSAFSAVNGEGLRDRRDGRVRPMDPSPVAIPGGDGGSLRLIRCRSNDDERR